MAAFRFDRSISRRELLLGTVLGGGLAALASACASAPAAPAANVPAPAQPAAATAGAAITDVGPAAIALSSWNNPGDLESLKKFAADYTSQHPSVTIDVQVTPSTNFDEWFGTRLAGGQAPDIIRVQYQQLGRYVANGGLIDLTPYLPADYGKDYLPTFWGAVQQKNGVYGIPEHTDTFATFYRTDIMQKIGVTPPTSMDKAWRWDEFLTVARQVKAATGQYAFGYGYSGANTAYRWLPLLYMHGGKLLADDGKTPAIDSPEGISALAWTQSAYQEGLIPPNNSVKGSQSTTARQYFIDGVVGMMLHGDWQMQTLQTTMNDQDWGVTYMIQDVGKASDLGGNALAITKDAKNPKAAADVLLFVSNPANTQAFITDNVYIPVLVSLSGKPIQYAYRPDQMQKFVEQATTVPESMARVETMAQFADINLMLADQLDLCFSGQQSPQQTATAISDGVKKVLA
jgi:multiple sugar transport system substrate-binding protein